jgi:hypothetical protein
MAAHASVVASVLTADGSDFLLPDLSLIAGNQVLNEHDSHDGLCAVCGTAWPCQFTQVAGSDFIGF